MNTRLRSFITSTLAATLMAFSAVSYADDTEIYFAQANVDNQENKPAANVLFLLDTSGSMSGQKMRDLKAAFKSVVSGLNDNISVGIGRFNGSTGGYVFYPVTPMTETEKINAQNLADQLPASGNTPTLEAYTEMARYMLGESPNSDYTLTGTAIQDSPSIAVNASYQCISYRNNGNCRTWGYVSSNNYESPINSANQCESNHIIVMTDGAPVSDADRTSRDYVKDQVGFTCATSTSASSSYSCQADLAKWLYNNGNDVGSATNPSRKSIKTWQVGFQMSSNRDNMDDVAKNGGTEFARQADSVEELTAAFVDILDLIDGQSRSISAPGIAVNTMNRFQHLDELYYAVFQPAESSYWEGNLKSYRLADQEIRGQNGNAIDPSTGYFKPEARSYWSSEVDGADAQKGGAREQVAERRLFYSNASGATRQLDWNSGRNTDPRNSYFKLDDTTTLSSNSNPGDAQRTAMFTRLKSMWGDPMHSVPLMVNYGGDQNYVFVSNNGGMLHIIDTSDGSEAAAFMPHELFEKAPQFTTHRPPLRLDNTRQIYGLDASWVAWRKPGEKITDAPAAVYLYGGMRRGGKHFYALDVSNPQSPSLKWQIDAGDTGFSRLGQTWSTPTLTRISTGEDSSVPALVFGGGYSPDDHDNHQNRQSSDDMGNTVYIVNAENGELIWSASHADMKWAIPGGISVVDKDFDGVADFLYFADLGGQVFRADLENSSSRTVQLIAQLGGSGSDHRRFYEAPSVAYVKEGAENHLYVAVASGYRAHPLDEETDEGLFVVIDKDAMGSSNSTLATISNMADVASNEELDPDTHRGWYYLFQTDTQRPGEKALASPVIFDNTILLSTYAPTMDQEFDNPCAVRYGAAYLHTVNLRSGAPASLNKDLDPPQNRSQELAQSTPPPTPTIMVDEHGKIVVVVGTEVIDDDELNDPNLRKRRWMQLPKNEAGEILQPAEGED